MKTARRVMASALGVLTMAALLVVLPAGPAAAAVPDYEPVEFIPTGYDPVTSVPVDVDLDGDLDLAVPNVITWTLSILINDGSGTFAAPVDLALPGAPVHALAADVTGDGIDDMVLALREGQRSVGILPGDGTGSFGPIQTVAAGPRPHAVDVGDTDGDGDLDLLVAHCCGSPHDGNHYITHVRNNGDGTFQPPVVLATGVNIALDLLLVDADHDGDLDAVGALRVGALLATWLNDGTGGFGPVTHVAVPGVQHLARADADGDGDMDLYVSSGTTDLHLIESIPGPTWGPITTVAMPVSTLTPIIGDMDGDGVDDAVVTHWGGDSVTIVRSVPGAAPVVDTSIFVGLWPNRGNIADLNGDGRPDLALTNQLPAGGAAIVLSSPPPACGVGPTFVVDETIDDDGSATPTLCSLREAVLAANAHDGPATVQVPAGIYSLTLAGTGDLGQLEITGDITLTGDGPTSTVIDANGIGRHFVVVAGASLDISAVRLTTLTATGLSGGLSIGGAATVTGVVIDTNRALNGGAITIGGAASSLDLRNSTLADNTATFEGGAINHSSAGRVRVTNTTITGNHAGQGGVLVTRGTSDTVVNASTMVGNTAADKGGITPINSSIVVVRNSILAGNSVPAGASDCDIAVRSGGHNVFGACAVIAGPDDIVLGGVPASAVVESLTDNGGPTPTMLPLNPGPAIDAGNPAAPGSDGSACPTDDQRGVPRGADPCDVGAVEAGTTIDTTPPDITITTPPDGATIEAGTTIEANYTCTDLNLATCTGPIPNGDTINTTTLGTQTFTVTATDTTGNTTTQTHTYTITDTTPPDIVGAADRAPNGAGWYDAPVAVTWSVVDPPPSSGIGIVPADTVATTEGTWVYHSEPGCDLAGNCAVGSIALSIDTVAPTVGDVTATPNPVALGQSTTVSGSASDAISGLAGGEIFVGADPGEGNGQPATLDAAGLLSATLAGLPVGVHEVSMRAVDAAGNWSAPAPVLVVVFDPDGGFVTGGGWVESPAGALIDSDAQGRANFGFVARYQRGASTPDGNTRFRFAAGDVDFRAVDFEWLVVAGTDRAKFKGKGTLNGEGGFGFMLTAVDDDASGDTFRIKIWRVSDDTVVYDNQRGAGDDSYVGTALGGGSIEVHVPRGRR